MIPTENAEQAALFQWADFAALTYPELVMMYAIPNGGLRDARTAVTLQRTGVKSGVPDICLPVARGGYNGLYIEMKRQKGGVLSANQKIWIDRLRAHGNKAAVCKGWEQARLVILGYLDSK